MSFVAQGAAEADGRCIIGCFIFFQILMFIVLFCVIKFWL